MFVTQMGWLMWLCQWQYDTSTLFIIEKTSMNSDSFIHSHFWFFQVGSIYIWSYVYNLVRIFTCKSSNIDTVQDSTVNSVSATETDPENHSKCSTGQLVTVGDSSQANDHVGQLEIECKMPDKETKVVLCSDLIG